MYPYELSRVAIQALIPHRDPFLFIERAQVESSNEISGQAIWPRTHPILQGHFPHRPVVPGVCLLESGAQLAGVLLHWRIQQLDRQGAGSGFLVSVQNAKFRQVLEADQILMLHCRVRTLNSRACWVKCGGMFSEKTVVEGEFIIALQF